MSPETMAQALYDRMQIEELFTRYYSGLDAGDPEGFGRYFVEGAELDVNGYVAHGFSEIADLYRAVSADKPRLTGQFRMILSNLVIALDGDTATAQMLWTQTLNDTIKGPPRLIEQGREFDRLTKQDGRWRITKRVVIADSGLPDIFDETYVPRADFRI
ncbi:nuclear transport factor 2 family protein [Sphingomonas sp. MMS24-J13]|uniref:nuclear transport factor 2 family protein n=1 Tax=Sphingomonas sp. MMS24-J13 TaxID=3238686 RepID=UPI00384EFF2E